MLPLYGRATHTRGMSDPGERQVIRLASPRTPPLHGADVALVRSAEDYEQAHLHGFACALTFSDSAEVVPNVPSRLISVPKEFSYLGYGDILGFDLRSGHFRALYRRSSRHNSFLVTDRCNHYCLMCSQPPKNVDDRWRLREIREALPLVDKQTQSICFTGGEPLLDWSDLVQALGDCRDLLPQTAVHVLTNGRAFASPEVARAWSDLRHPGLTAGIPIYSATDDVHDYVVQAKGAWDETVLGILRMKDRAQRVEVRVVLHAITAPRIVETCRWLARNLPFVDHVALMGLENTGFAIANDQLLWIDPIDYRDQLAEGVQALISANVRTSIYNLPRCLLSPSIWPYAVQSISDWKNDYLDECARCDERARCSGFFATGRPRYSRGIRAIVRAANTLVGEAEAAQS